MIGYEFSVNNQIVHNFFTKNQGIWKKRLRKQK